jgi:hypothetical protein
MRAEYEQDEELIDYVDDEEVAQEEQKANGGQGQEIKK